MYENNSRGFLPYMWGTLASVIATAIFVLISAAILASQEYSDTAVLVMSTAAVLLGAAVGGFVCAKINGGKGLLSGLVTGFASFLIIELLSLAINPSAVTVISLLKLAASLLGAAAGGVAGVNIRKKQKMF